MRLSGLIAVDGGEDFDGVDAERGEVIEGFDVTFNLVDVVDVELNPLPNAQRTFRAKYLVYGIDQSRPELPLIRLTPSRLLYQSV